MPDQALEVHAIANFMSQKGRMSKLLRARSYAGVPPALHFTRERPTGPRQVPGPEKVYEQALEDMAGRVFEVNAIASFMSQRRGCLPHYACSRMADRPSHAP